MTVMFAHSNQRSLKILKAAVIISLSQIEGSDYMDVDEKTQIIRSFAEEIITEEELKQVFETKTHPVTYDGFEPSGLAHLPFGVYRPLLIKDMQKTGIKFKLWLADWFSWINNKMGGDLEKIKVSFLNVLIGQHYRRIRYPKQDQMESENNDKSTS